MFESEVQLFDRSDFNETSSNVPLSATGIIVVSLTSVVVLLTLFGNIVSIIVFMKSQALRDNSATPFLLSLCSSDVLVALVCLPVWSSLMLIQWLADDSVGMHIWLTLDILCSVLSIASLTLVSIERCITVVHPLDVHRLLTRARIRLAVIAIWAYSLAVSLPNVWYLSKNWYRLLLSMASYVIPVTTMTVCYIKIFIVVCKQAEEMSKMEVTAMRLKQAQDPSNGGSNLQEPDQWQKNPVRDGAPSTSGNNDRQDIAPPTSSKDDRQDIAPPTSGKDVPDEGNTKNHSAGVQPSLDLTTSDDNRQDEKAWKTLVKSKSFLLEMKAAKTVGIVMGCFVLCWTPYIIILISMVFEIMFPTWYFLAAKILHYINSALNPILYYVFNKPFRTFLKRYFIKVFKSISPM